MHCTAYLILGSNIDDKVAYLNEASHLLSANDLQVVKSSSFYETAAWGLEDQEPFINQALEVSTSLSPLDLLTRCQKIEFKLGRVREEKWGPRTIDIDIAYYENLIISVEELSLPQNNLENRSFALTPLCELAPNNIHPILLKSNKELLISCSDSLPVKKIDEQA